MMNKTPAKKSLPKWVQILLVIGLVIFLIVFMSLMFLMSHQHIIGGPIELPIQKIWKV